MLESNYLRTRDFIQQILSANSRGSGSEQNRPPNSCSGNLLEDIESKEGGTLCHLLWWVLWEKQSRRGSQGILKEEHVENVNYGGPGNPRWGSVTGAKIWRLCGGEPCRCPGQGPRRVSAGHVCVTHRSQCGWSDVIDAKRGRVAIRGPDHTGVSEQL